MHVSTKGKPQIVFPIHLCERNTFIKNKFFGNTLSTHKIKIFLQYKSKLKAYIYETKKSNQPDIFDNHLQKTIVKLLQKIFRQGEPVSSTQCTTKLMHKID